MPWAARMALDDCRTFEAAVGFLCEVELLSPVLFTLAGSRPGEALTTERGPGDYNHRRCEDGSTITTNHYASDEYEGDNVDLEEMSTLERFEELEAALEARPCLAPADGFKVLSKGWVNDEHTQHRCVMSAADGLLQVQLPGGRPVSVPL